MSMGNRKRRKALGLIPEREKCKARNRFGEPCGNYPIEGAVVCHTHGGSAPQVKRKAQERIAMAQDDAAALLTGFMASNEVPFSERRRIAEFLLTYENRNVVQLALAKWEQGLDEVFVDYSDTDKRDIVEAQVIEAGKTKPYRTTLPALSKDDPAPPKYGTGRRDG